MKKADPKNRKRILRGAVLFASSFSLVSASVFCSYADITSDAPQLSDEPSIFDFPNLPGASEIGGGSSSDSSGGSSGSDSGGSSDSGSGSSSGIIITDEPSLGGSSGSSKGGTVSTAPVTGKTNGASEAPVSETSAKTAVQSVQTSVATGPSSQSKTSAGTGSVYANDAVSRISLDFSLITPNHVKGSLHVARGCVQLTDGSWQNFDYEDNIHYAFFKLKDTKTDSSGTTWYIADVKARRFGDTAAADGEYKTELWLNASDCIVRSTIDVNTTSTTRIAIVKAALSQLGKKYTYGATGPDAYDCSALVKYVCAQAGISVPRTSTQLLQLDGQITAAELRPGDILARAGHCGIYIGNGIFVHASDSSVGVVAEYLSVYNLSNKFTNYINVVGD